MNETMNMKKLYITPQTDFILGLEVVMKVSSESDLDHGLHPSPARNSAAPKIRYF